MIALYLIAAHLTGDFLLQGRWMAEEKQNSDMALIAHVLVYSLCFAPVVVWGVDVDVWHALGFVWAVMALHTITDSHRFTSTPADVIGWQWRRWRDPTGVRIAWVDHLYGPEATGFILHDGVTQQRRLWQAENITGRTLWMPPPNPWPGVGLAVDQSLHILQIAALAAVFL